jgi:DNA polymerase III subunit beta
MKLIVLQENIKAGLAIVAPAIAGKSTLPVLANVLLTAADGRLTLTATNLEIGIQHAIGAQVETPGAVTLPHKLLSDVIGGLPNDRVTLTLDERTQTVKIECGRFVNNIKGIEADEFPTIPQVDTADAATIPGAALKRAIELTAFAAASDDSRPVLSGVLLRLGASLFLAAADGFRMAVQATPLPEPTAHPLECIIPARALDALSRLLRDDTPVSLGLAPTGSQIGFESGDTILVSRLIEGRFPDIERIIPQSHMTRTVLPVADLARAVKMASYFAAASQGVVKLTMTPGGELGPGCLVISANAAEVGDSTVELDALISGEGGQIALNVKYLAEVLGAVKCETVAIETQAATSPGVLKPVGSDGYTHIIMPMAIR